jgi:histidinol-phosphate aminotransferase
MLRRYPDPTAWGFRTAAARLHGLSPDHIVAANGGDELLRLALTTFLPPGAPLGLASTRCWPPSMTARCVACR